MNYAVCCLETELSRLNYVLKRLKREVKEEAENSDHNSLEMKQVMEYYETTKQAESDVREALIKLKR